MVWEPVGVTTPTSEVRLEGRYREQCKRATPQTVAIATLMGYFVSNCHKQSRENLDEFVLI